MKFEEKFVQEFSTKQASLFVRPQIMADLFPSNYISKTLQCDSAEMF